MATASPLILSAQGYTDEVLLGSGAFGSVYSCVDDSGQRQAVKVSTELRGRELAALEAELMLAVPPHVNVLTLLSFKSTPEATLLALPLATGGDVLRFLQDRGGVPLPEDDARHLFLQLISGLEHMHKAGIVHRDIKLENLLLTGDRRRTLVIADFGFAGRWSKGSMLTDAWGSLHYSSPEICACTPYEGPEVDVWSAGVVLYAMTTGRLPFGGSESRMAHLISTGTFALPNTISPELADLIRGMLTVDQAQRATIEEIWQHPWMRRPSPEPSPLVQRHTSSPVGGYVDMLANEERRASVGTLPVKPTKLQRIATTLRRAIFERK